MKLKNNDKRGFLISVEGIDGSGKSLFSQLLFQALQEAGHSVVLTREPGGTPFSDKIRNLIFSKEIHHGKKAEYLLFAASRAQHCEELVLPALDHGKIVISDRMADSSLVYQGYVQGLSLEMINTINEWAMNNRKPDLIFYLKVSAKTAYERITQRKVPLTSFENSITVLEKAIEGFDTLVAPRDTVITIDAQQDPSLSISQALSLLFPLLTERVPL